MNKNYLKATSENLPKVDLEMLLDYIASNNNFQSAEMRGVKTVRSMRDNYGDQAIGYVQLLRQNDTCTVQAKVFPEHRIRKNNYSVQVVIHEKEEKVIKAECMDCAAALGGCKHAVALLAWLHRSSEEPSPTSVSCYWKKSMLSNIGKDGKSKKISDIFKKYSSVENDEVSEDVLDLFLNHPDAKNCNAHLVKFYNQNNTKKLSLHFLSSIYKGDVDNISEFEEFCKNHLDKEQLDHVSQVTIGQSDNNLCYELRYGRITASVIYDAAMCKTLNGSLVEKFFSVQDFDTKAMKRGRYLENIVLEEIKEYIFTKYKEKIEKCGLLRNKQYLMFGASPDGITEKSVVEIKCPYKNKSICRYYSDGKINNKYRAQLHLQMLFAEKSKEFFCIAEPDFEKSRKVHIITEHFDKNFIMPIIQKATIFWKQAIFPKLMKSET